MFDSSILLLLMIILPNDSFMNLLTVCDDLCWELFVFPVNSCAFLCIPMCSLCIRIDPCQTLFVNCVQLCTFSMASNRPLLEICQSRAFSMKRAGLCWTFAHPVSILYQNFCVFIGIFLYCMVEMGSNFSA